MTNSNQNEIPLEASMNQFQNKGHSKSSSDETVTDSDQKYKGTCLDLVKEFAEYTTLHGLRQIVLGDSFVLIR